MDHLHVFLESRFSIKGGCGDKKDVDGRKRVGQSIICATSPQKKTKSPMVRIMKGIWETMQKSAAAT
jgi:hypothetical protein